MFAGKEMPKPFHVLLFLISVAGFLTLVRAQEAPATTHTGNQKTLVVATEAKRLPGTPLKVSGSRRS